MNSDIEDGPASPQNHGGDETSLRPHKLPEDLPRTLDDRKPAQAFGAEYYDYDAWQGQATYLSAPAISSNPLNFNLSLDEGHSHDDLSYVPARLSTESRLDQMVAAQAAHREDVLEKDEDNKTALDAQLPDTEKRERLQRALHASASNGDVARMQALLHGPARQFIDVNGPDEEGTAPLLYASCFGHTAAVKALLDAGAVVDQQMYNNGLH